MWFPSDAEIGTMRVWMTDYISTHIIVSTFLVMVIGYTVKKTKTKFDDKAWAWIKNKIGLK